MPIPTLPGIWDTHTHLLDPDRFPYSEDRSYTPYPARVPDLLRASPGHNFLVAQASVEDGYSGLVTQLQELNKSDPERTFRGAIMPDGSSLEASKLQEQTLHDLHSAGVRGLRLRLSGIQDAQQAATASKTFLSGHIGVIARRYKWAISMQVPLQTWALLADFIASQCVGVTVIAEHCASLRVPMSMEDMAALEDVLAMLRKKLIFVKLGGLHRRLKVDASLDDLRQPIRNLAISGPRQLLWGSDWPHVNVAGSKSIETEHLSIDARAELEQLCAWLPADCVEAMLCSTPSTLFGL